MCKHRLSAAIARRAQALTSTASQPDAPATPPVALPEAPASVNVHLEIGGRQDQLTLRDTDETRLLERLAAILERYPVPTKPADDTPRYPQHGAMKRSSKGKGFYCAQQAGE